MISWTINIFLQNTTTNTTQQQIIKINIKIEELFSRIL